MTLKQGVVSPAIGAVLAAGILVALGQTAGTKSDEQALRELIQQRDQGKDVIKYTENAIFVSGAFPQGPVYGREAAKPKREEIAKSRPNQSTKHNVERLVVSKSGDMAYEFGNFTDAYDGADKKRTGFKGSYLRVWRKIDGEWQVDVAFARRNEP